MSGLPARIGMVGNYVLGTEKCDGYVEKELQVMLREVDKYFARFMQGGEMYN